MVYGKSEANILIMSQKPIGWCLREQTFPVQHGFSNPAKLFMNGISVHINGHTLILIP